MTSYEIEVFPVGLFQCNCSIIFDFQSKQALIVDPGDESENILTPSRRNSSSPIARLIGFLERNFFEYPKRPLNLIEII
jgi:hypothetical protein